MQATDQPMGLRERKKIKTRQAIRREAFRLFDAHGYAATTVEQIADAAEVSPSTFFRYFPSKESLLLADDLDPLILAAFRAQPPELSPTQAIRRAYESTMAALSDEQSEFESTRQRLIFSIPELKAALYDEYHRTVTVMAEAIGDRIGRPADDFEVRVFVGAMVGAMMSAYDSAPKTAETIYRALNFLDAGMPLSGPGPRTR
ncbi:TetR family transcriptional regulator [Mycobacterium sp. 852002-50816_SCH5313054-b]|uniref:acyl-CoA-like ligand-binding transcription factor n=1 Tax=Mycobacterium sp. 852002-50816_SCH5313054-b TaxID=1834092 RepID=UPI00080148B1|nr:TetR family transcriptional regulator [Mycobacterium sp. 852002-50816_SCH5313054-b]OBF54498.1 TetR family transcriptional regulator [Mycobacterium sp. 852002-50816_SCH5313054-b]